MRWDRKPFSGSTAGRAQGGPGGRSADLPLPPSNIQLGCGKGPSCLGENISFRKEKLFSRTWCLRWTFRGAVAFERCTSISSRVYMAHESLRDGYSIIRTIVQPVPLREHNIWIRVSPLTFTPMPLVASYIPEKTLT